MKPIANFENRYKITAAGSVVNLANNQYLAPIKNPNGYLKVSLADGEGGAKQLSIHRLVALHFIPNPYQHPQVNHKNGNKQDNQVENLEWCSAQENHEHAFKTGLRPGYLSADEKEAYLQAVLVGVQVKDLAKRLNRRPETLHRMLRTTADRLHVRSQWDRKMKENRRDAAIRNLAKINN